MAGRGIGCVFALFAAVAEVWSVACDTIVSQLRDGSRPRPADLAGRRERPTATLASWFSRIAYWARIANELKSRQNRPARLPGPTLDAELQLAPRDLHE